MSDVNFTLCFEKSFFGVLFLRPRGKLCYLYVGKKRGKKIREVEMLMYEC